MEKSNPWKWLGVAQDPLIFALEQKIHVTLNNRIWEVSEASITSELFYFSLFLSSWLS